MVFVILDWWYLCQWTCLLMGSCQLTSHPWEKCESYSSNNNLRLFCTGVESSWQGGLKVSDVTVLDIIFFKVILLAWCVSPWSVEFNSNGSRCPVYLPLWKVRCLLVWLETMTFTVDLSLILWIPSIMLMLGSFPLGVLSSVIKWAVSVVISGPLILMGTTPLCLGGILRVDLTVPIVAFGW